MACEVVDTGSNTRSHPVLGECEYAYCYCEENVHKLCQRFLASGVHQHSNCYVVFISNPQKSVPLWRSINQQSPSLTLWDYHVILVERSDAGAMVYDMDSGLDFPCNIGTYMRVVVRDDPSIERCHRWFRVIKASLYVEHFSSDRRHMLDLAGRFIATPPTWAAIFDQARGHNLDQFVSMDPTKLTAISQVYDLPGFKQLLGC